MPPSKQRTARRVPRAAAVPAPAARAVARRVPRAALVPLKALGERLGATLDNIVLPTIGGDANTWGTKVNAAITGLAAAVDAEVTRANNAYIPLPGSPSDGQVLAYNAATGLWVAVNPSGASQLAYAENNTGTAQTGITNGTANVTGCSIAVPASSRPVYLSGGATLTPTTISANTIMQVQIVEVSNGVDTPVTLTAYYPVTTTSSTAFGATINLAPIRLAASTARTRTFNLVINATAQVTITCSNGAATGGRSWIAAEAR